MLESLPLFYTLAAAVCAALLGYALGLRSGASPHQARIAELEEAVGRHRRSAKYHLERSQAAEEMARRVQRSIAELPEIAQRLSAARDIREVPERALDLIDEIFEPSYSAFYRTGHKGLVAVAVRGSTELRVGHRVESGKGIVGWTAVKQLVFTPEDAEFESGLVKARNLSEQMPVDGFSLSVPILNRDRTIGVILVGPFERPVIHQREIARTVALITSVTIAGAVVLREQTRLAQTDGLTGLMNRTHLLRNLHQQITNVEGGAPKTISVFLFDIDHFKHYNDTNGHLRGDDLLKELSSLLKANVRESELVGRYGGEEFLLVLPGAEKKEATGAAERIRRLVEEQGFPCEERQPLGRITITGGVATWPTDAGDVETLLERADRALYRGKHEGRDRVIAYSRDEFEELLVEEESELEELAEGEELSEREEPLQDLAEQELTDEESEVKELTEAEDEGQDVSGG